MTSIKLSWEHGTARLDMQGHATGRPDVCAALSMLAYSWALYAAGRHRAGACEVLQYQEDPGMQIVAKVPEALRPAWDMLVCGFEHLAERYPEQVKIKKEG